MISFESWDFPSSIDEVLGERRMFIEYEFTDEGLNFEVIAVSDNGDKETIEHLFSNKETHAILRLIAQNEHEAYIQGAMI
jgi:glyceraldehyde-3-phosphate dehydrogenase/erythrose-4-phosphate dehydrogenase